MANIDKIIKSKNLPKQTNVAWVDLSGETPIEKHFINGRWVAVSGGGGSGGVVEQITSSTENVIITPESGTGNVSIGVNSPKIVDLGNDWFTDEIVESLKVGDIIKVPGSFFGSNIYTVYRTEYDPDLDVVTNYLFQINEGDDEIDFCILHKIDDSWTIELINEILKGVRVQTSSLPTSGGILPNVVYKLGTLANDASITITLATPTDDSFANVYTVTFDTGDWDTSTSSVVRGPSVSWGLPVTTHWADGDAPSIEPNTSYEVSIMDDIAVCVTAEKVRNLLVEP